MKGIELLLPDWPAPPQVRAGTTTRQGGVSLPPYNTLNLASHVGDEPRAVAENRRRLREQLQLPEEPRWLNQVHGRCAADAAVVAAPCDADASFTALPGVVCAVLTADCLPLLLCDRAGTKVAAVHAGWRGLHGGVIEQTVRAMNIAGEELLAWLGPAIGPAAFEVGGEVRDAFMAVDARAAQAFRTHGERWLADLYLLARQRLAAVGVTDVFGGGRCTFHEPDKFYSYRREAQTGRMASLIWLEV
ncbi:MAG TPA: peptidoglycan editing factor PgeF [Gammaproteobacteria bacterium]